MKYDPSKFCHAVKQIDPKDKDHSDVMKVSVNDLTWNLKEVPHKNTFRVYGQSDFARDLEKEKRQPIAPYQKNVHVRRRNSSSDSSDSDEQGDSCDTDDTDEMISRKRSEQVSETVGSCELGDVKQVSSWLESESSEDEEPPAKKRSISIASNSGMPSNKGVGDKMSPIKASSQMKGSSLLHSKSIQAERRVKDTSVASSSSGERKLDVGSKPREKPKSQAEKKRKIPPKTQDVPMAVQEAVVDLGGVSVEDDQDSAGSADTGELISSMSRTRFANKDHVRCLSGQVPADEFSSFLVPKGISDTGGAASSEGSDADSEDLFDMLESGKVGQVYKQAQEDVAKMKERASKKDKNTTTALLSTQTLAKAARQTINCDVERSDSEDKGVKSLVKDSPKLVYVSGATKEGKKGKISSQNGCKITNPDTSTATQKSCEDSNAIKNVHNPIKHVSDSRSSNAVDLKLLSLAAGKKGTAVADKHALSNQMRLASLKQKEQQLKSQKNLLKQALATVVRTIILHADS